MTRPPETGEQESTPTSRWILMRPLALRSTPEEADRQPYSTVKERRDSFPVSGS